jgi:hypothetical protein
MLGSEGVACVVDPQRDVSLYIDECRAGHARPLQNRWAM